MTCVLIGSRFAPDVEGLLKDAPSEAEVTFLPDGDKPTDYLSGIEVLFGILSESDFDPADELKWVQQPHAGAEGHLYERFKNSDIVLTNAGGLFGPQIAEHAFALLLSLTRQIHTQLEFMKSKQWRGAPCLELAGMTMGIIGLGGIGRAIADRAKAFEFRVIAVDPEDMKPPASVDRLEKMDYLPELMSQSSVVMICCPITAETHKLLSQGLFDRLKAGSFLINVSRGKVVDEAAMIAALRSGKLAGVGLDVTYTEPCPQDSPLWTLPNVILTSHSAGGSQHFPKRSMARFVDNLHRYVKGEPLQNVVDKEKGY